MRGYKGRLVRDRALLGLEPGVGLTYSYTAYTGMHPQAYICPNNKIPAIKLDISSQRPY